VFGVLIVLCICGVAAAAGPSLRSYLLRSGEQPGYTVTKHSLVSAHTAAAYVRAEFGPLLTRAQQKAAVRRLKKAGFVGAAGEELHGARKRWGASAVVAFNNPRSADQLAKLTYKQAVSLYKVVVTVQGGKLSRFALPGIHPSYGVTVRSKPAADAEVVWVEGDCVLFSAQGLRHGSGLTPRQIATRVTTGAESQRARTNGTCPALAATFTG
jgi:hypothetical protein